MQAQVKVKTNAKDWPKEYTCNYIEPGIVSYEDMNAGIAMLRAETIAKYMRTFIGKPVIIEHKKLTPANFEKHSVGYVTEVYQDEYSGWFYCKFLLTNDEAKDKVAQGYSVSCGYKVLATKPGGEWHAIKYDEEITELEFNHLALVINPRYEDCRIYENSKGAAKVIKQEEQKMFKLFSRQKKQDERYNTADLFVDVDGEKVSVDELLKYNSVDMQEIGEQSEIEDADGNKIKVADLVNSYRANKKNEKKDDDKENEDDEDKENEEEDEDKKNEEDKDKKENEDEEEKKNAKKDVSHFVKLNSLRDSGGMEPVKVETVFTRAERGKQRYGSQK